MRIVFVNYDHPYTSQTVSKYPEKEKSKMMCEMIKSYLGASSIVCLQGVPGDTMRLIKDTFKGTIIYYYSHNKTPVIPPGKIISFDNLLKYPDEFMCIILPLDIKADTNFWVQSQYSGAASAICKIGKITIVNIAVPGTVEGAETDIKRIQENFEGDKIIIGNFGTYKFSGFGNIADGVVASVSICDKVILSEKMLEITPYPEKTIIYE
jgi:hypothetical protein